MPIGITITFYLFLISLFVACLLEALFPKWIWKTFSSWKATKEPSNAYFLRQRISGIIGMIIIIAIALGPTLIAYFDK